MGLGTESAIFNWLRKDAATREQVDTLIAEIRTTNGLLARLVTALADAPVGGLPLSTAIPGGGVDERFPPVGKVERRAWRDR